MARKKRKASLKKKKKADPINRHLLSEAKDVQTYYPR